MMTFRPSTTVPILVLLALAAVPLVAAMTGQTFLITFCSRLVIYAIAATALNLALGYGGLVSFGHALFLGLGMYAVGLPSFYGVGSGWVHLGAGVVVCALAALITGAISLRTAGIAFIMITLAFAQMGYYLVVSLKVYGGDDGLPITSNTRFGPIDLGEPNTLYLVSLAVLVVTTLWMARLRVSPFGMVLRGAQQNVRRVRALGFSAFRFQLAAYVVSGVICGVAGLLLANLNSFASPSTMSWIVSGELIVMVVLGGMGTVFGPILGTAAYLGLEELSKSFTEHWMVIFGPIIVVVALLGKSGIVGLLQRMDRRTRPVKSPEIALPEEQNAAN